MIQITIDDNEKNQRLDRFLRKYLNRAPLSLIYKMIRKDVKVNGKRAGEDTMLEKGDVVSLYLTKEEATRYRKVKAPVRAKKQFRVVYEDEEVLLVGKPLGLLTHGDEHERKNTLVNQVIDYLIEKGEYVPRTAGTFKPACVNRLDRNTTGLVIFGKTAQAVKDYNRLIADKDAIEKYYLAIVAGKVKAPMELTGQMVKDEGKNRAHLVESPSEAKTVESASATKIVESASATKIVESTSAAKIVESAGAAKMMESRVTPVKTGKQYSLVQVQLLTGRTHQIRLQLAAEGHPIVGDPKYGSQKVNEQVRKDLGLLTQLLHCHELVFREGPLAGQRFTCPPPETFAKAERALVR